MLVLRRVLRESPAAIILGVVSGLAASLAAPRLPRPGVVLHAQQHLARDGRCIASSRAPLPHADPRRALRHPRSRPAPQERAPPRPRTAPLCRVCRGRPPRAWSHSARAQPLAHRVSRVLGRHWRCRRPRGLDDPVRGRRHVLVSGASSQSPVSRTCSRSQRLLSPAESPAASRPPTWRL